MEKYYKNIKDNYITSISTGCGMEEITQEEYENILSIVHSHPIPEDGYGYRLRTDLTWEIVKIEIIPENEDEVSCVDNN